MSEISTTPLTELAPSSRLSRLAEALDMAAGPDEATADDAGSAAAPAQRRRSNRRSEQTIESILAATEQVVLVSGAERISILDVCKVASVSRKSIS